MPKTQPEPIRDPKADLLLTPENCVLALIDFQPGQYATVTSASRAEIDLGVVTLAKIAAAYGIPTVVTTVAVDMGVNEGTVPEIMDELPGVMEIDRTGVNAWEDSDFRAAIEATGRRKIVLAGLWTEVCLAFPTLDMLAEGYEVYPVADAVGGVSQVTHDRAFDRMIQAGAHPVTAIAFGCEIMRNWARGEADLFRPIINWYFQSKRELGLWGGGQVPSAGS
ncbi:hydrolase [Nocardioides jiangxiensis]|uniref:Hydrolase n=1 Tax=Nocardioides jiangxiensis TaxID=3064524 RepID=A0ABT9B5C7_9ACTN|nr:hydrolase [Nocardioides sp. WY-20]MDO7869595.1 hydrolase [Nocardioides sp. WY-20]